MKLKVYIVVLVLMLQACAKMDDGFGPSSTESGAALYFKGNVNNKAVLFEAGEDGYNIGNTWRSNQFPIWGSHFVNISSNQDAISVFISNYSQAVDPDAEKDLKRTAVVGNKKYSTAPHINEDEVFISYRRNGISYESALIDQSGLDFQIQEVKDTIYQDKPFIIAKVRFNALLFSFVNQDTLEIKNGEARMAFKAKM